MTAIIMVALAVFSAVMFLLGRQKAGAVAGRTGVRLHSLPGYYGWFAALWAGVPALLILIGLLVFGSRIEDAILTQNLVPAVSALPYDQQALFLQDARALAEGRQPSETLYVGALHDALLAKVSAVKSVNQTVTYGAWALAGVLALLGAGLALVRIKPQFWARNRVESWISGFLIICSAMAILTTVGIILSLIYESLRFFQSVSPLDFLTGTHWSPQIAIREDQVGSTGGFGAVPLFAGTFLVMLIAILVAGPIGLFSAIYLSEYASPLSRAVIKPVLEVLAGVPTVVYGFFAALAVGPAFRSFFNFLGAELQRTGQFPAFAEYLMTVQNQMALVAGVVMGIMLIPFVSSLSDDIINSVPQSLRDGSLAMGATKSETVKKVILPAALPGIAGAFLLAISRAVGETMIVTMAAGLQANLTANPLDTVTTVTVQIVTLLTGDQEFDSPKTLAAFGLGLTLFVVTLLLNIIALRIVQKYREQYD